jgi:hypothetical protein
MKTTVIYHVSIPSGPTGHVPTGSQVSGTWPSSHPELLEIDTILGTTPPAVKVHYPEVQGVGKCPPPGRRHVYLALSF